MEGEQIYIQAGKAAEFSKQGVELIKAGKSKENQSYEYSIFQINEMYQ
ncbi:hypothetical protein NUACC21_47790 [Scytonema sp. NUACC21]